MDNQERAQASYSTLNFMVLEDDPELDRSVEWSSVLSTSATRIGVQARVSFTLENDFHCEDVVRRRRGGKGRERGDRRWSVVLSSYQEFAYG